MIGWIKLHRKTLENAVFYKPDYFQIWAYILLNVNHEEKAIIWNNQKKIIKKGSGIFSQKEMGKIFKFEISKINRILNYLKNENQITFIGYSKYTEIQVVNWSEYQDAIENGNQKETWKKPEGNQKESQQKPGGNLEETNKNVKNEENENNDKNFINISGEQIFEETIIEFFNTNFGIIKPNYQKIFPLANIDDCLKKFILLRAFESFNDAAHFRNSFKYLLADEQKNNSKKKQSSGPAAGGKITQEVQLNQGQHARNSEKYGNTDQN